MHIWNKVFKIPEKVENKMGYFKKFIGKSEHVLIEKITHGIANGYGQHYIPVRFKVSGELKNTVHAVTLTEIRGTDEDMYLFGEISN